MQNVAPDATYTLEQVCAHSSPSDLWVVIYNSVYNITDFIKDHPGGGEVLFDCGGADATEAFEDVGHSQDAVDMLQPYWIGQLAPNDHRPYREKQKSEPKLKCKPSKSTNYRELTMVWIGLILVAILTVLGLQKAHWINLTAH